MRPPADRSSEGFPLRGSPFGRKWDVAVIGAGFAGASTAWWLRRAGVGSVALLEREGTPGARASGRNAGIARVAIADAPTAELAHRSVAFLSSPPVGFTPRPLFEPSGGILLASEEGVSGLVDVLDASEKAGVSALPMNRAEILDRVPFLEDSPFLESALSPSDGLVDIHGLLQAYLRGMDLFTSSAVTGWERSGSRIVAAELEGGRLEADHFVLACGAWSAELGALAGTFDLPLEPRRRHLIHTGRLDWVDPAIPYVWHLGPDVYFRPESGGLLLSPCDEEIFHSGDVPADSEAPVWLYERLERAFPKLKDVPAARVWADVRCFVPDARFVIGSDPLLENLAWVCALGGHGMTCSAAAGELAAALILGEEPPVDPAPFDPARLFP